MESCQLEHDGFWNVSIFNNQHRFLSSLRSWQMRCAINNALSSWCPLGGCNNKLKLEVGPSCHCNYWIVADVIQQEICCMSFRHHNCWVVLNTKQQKACWDCINVSEDLGSKTTGIQVRVDVICWSNGRTHQQCEDVAWNFCCESNGFTCQQCKGTEWNFLCWSNRLKSCMRMNPTIQSWTQIRTESCKGNTGRYNETSLFLPMPVGWLSIWWISTVGFSQNRDIVALVHKNPSYVESTR